MKADMPELKDQDIENAMYAYWSRLLRNGYSWVVTIRKEIIQGSAVFRDKPVFSQVVKFKGRTAVLVFLDNLDFNMKPCTEGKKNAHRGVAGK